VFCWKLLKDYMLELMVLMCVLLESVERLYAGIDGVNVCVLLEFVERLYARIDGFNVCVMLELSDSLYAGVVTTYVCVCSCRNVYFVVNL